MAELIDHPCVQHKLAIIRDVETGHKRFRELATEIRGVLRRLTRLEHRSNSVVLSRNGIRGPSVRTRSDS